MSRLEEKTSILYRFVVGHSLDKAQEESVDQEMKKNGACIRLPLVVSLRARIHVLTPISNHWSSFFANVLHLDIFTVHRHLAMRRSGWTISHSYPWIISAVRQLEDLSTYCS